jgi:hypothetical protein
MKSWSCAFQTNGMWYEMSDALYQKAKRAVGPEWNNAKIVAYLKANGYTFQTENDGHIACF